MEQKTAERSEAAGHAVDILWSKYVGEGIGPTLNDRVDDSESIAAFEALASWCECRGGKLPRDINLALVAGESLFVSELVSGGTDWTKKRFFREKPGKALLRWLAARDAGDFVSEVVS